METEKYNAFLNETLYVNRLSNGLTCYIIPKAGFCEKQALLCVNFGSVDNRFEAGGGIVELPDGVAHFLEHKLFEDEKAPVFNAFVKLGSHVNAFTSYSTTAYYFNCTDKFVENLSLLLDFTQSPGFSEESVEKEKGIIAQEINMYEDNPFWLMYRNMLEAMYHKCPVRKNIAGSEESITAIDRRTLYDAYDAFYFPGNMALICAGDFDRHTVYETAEKLVKQGTRCVPSRLFETEPEEVLENMAEARAPVSRPMINIGFKRDAGRLKDMNATDAARETVSARILMDALAGESSGFFAELYDNGAVDGPFGFEYTFSRLYAHSVFACSTADPAAAATALLNEIERVRGSGADGGRIEQIRRKHMGRFARSFNSIDSITMGQADLFSKGLDLFDVMNAYEEYDREEASKALNALFGAGRHVLSIMRPVDV